MEAIRDLAAEFQQNLTQGANEQILHVAEVLERVSSALEGTAEQSHENQRRLETSLDSHLGRLSETVTGLLGSISEQQQAVSSQTQEAFKGLLERMERSLATQQEQIEATSVNAREELLEGVKQVSSRISELLDGLSQQTNSTSEEMTTRLNTLSSMFDEKIRDVTDRYQEERSEISSLLGLIQAALSKMEDLLEGLALAGETFGASAPPVREATVGLNQAVSDLRQAQETFASTIVQSQGRSLKHIEKADEVLGQMLEALQTTRQSWSAYQERFGELRESLDAVFEGLHQGLGEYTQITQESLGGYLKALDGTLKSAVNTLSGAIENLQGVVEDLGDTSRRMRS